MNASVIGEFLGIYDISDTHFTSVRIDVEQLLRDRAIEIKSEQQENCVNGDLSKPKKRKPEGMPESSKTKKPKTKSDPKPPLPKISLTLKIGPRPPEQEDFPCCLCVSTNREGLLLVHDPPVGRKDIEELAGKPKVWMAHECCANVIPETWVDEVDEVLNVVKQRFVFGVDAIVKDRWNLVCHTYYFTCHNSFPAPEMLCMHKDFSQGSWSACTMYQGQVPESLSCQLRTRRPACGYHVHNIEGGREGSRPCGFSGGSTSRRSFCYAD